MARTSGALEPSTKSRLAQQLGQAFGVLLGSSLGAAPMSGVIVTFVGLELGTHFSPVIYMDLKEIDR